MENWVEWELEKQKGVMGLAKPQRSSLKSKAGKGKLSMPCLDDRYASHEGLCNSLWDLLQVARAQLRMTFLTQGLQG